MPSPKAGETEQAYIGRFMESAEARRDYPDEKQRAAVAFSMFRERENNGQMCGSCGAAMTGLNDTVVNDCGSCGARILGPITPAIEDLDNLCRVCRHAVAPEHDDFGCHVPDCRCSLTGAAAIDQIKSVLPNAGEVKNGRACSTPGCEHRAENFCKKCSDPVCDACADKAGSTRGGDAYCPKCGSPERQNSRKLPPGWTVEPGNDFKDGDGKTPAWAKGKFFVLDSSTNPVGEGSTKEAAIEDAYSHRLAGQDWGEKKNAASRADIVKMASDFKHNGATRASAHDALLKAFPGMAGDVRMVVDDIWPLHEGHRSNENSSKKASSKAERDRLDEVIKGLTGQLHQLELQTGAGGRDADPKRAPILKKIAEAEQARDTAHRDYITAHEAENKNAVGLDLAAEIWAVATPEDRGEWADRIGAGAQVAGAAWDAIQADEKSKLMALFDSMSGPAEANNAGSYSPEQMKAEARKLLSGADNIYSAGEGLRSKFHGATDAEVSKAIRDAYDSMKSAGELGNDRDAVADAEQIERLAEGIKHEAAEIKAEKGEVANASDEAIYKELADVKAELKKLLDAYGGLSQAPALERSRWESLEVTKAGLEQQLKTMDNAGAQSTCPGCQTKVDRDEMMVCDECNTRFCADCVDMKKGELLCKKCRATLSNATEGKNRDKFEACTKCGFVWDPAMDYNAKGECQECVPQIKNASEYEMTEEARKLIIGGAVPSALKSLMKQKYPELADDRIAAITSAAYRRLSIDPAELGNADAKADHIAMIKHKLAAAHTGERLLIGMKAGGGLKVMTKEEAERLDPADIGSVDVGQGLSNATPSTMAEREAVGAGRYGSAK